MKDIIEIYSNLLSFSKRGIIMEKTIKKIIHISASIFSRTLWLVEIIIAVIIIAIFNRVY